MRIFLKIAIILLLFSGASRAADKNESIKVYDKDGKEYLISRDVYRKNVLPGIFEKAWDDEKELYGVIVAALRDGLYQDALAPAIRHVEISKNKESSSVLLGIAYMKLGRLTEAHETLDGYVSRYGKSGIVLTNLAKVIAMEGDFEKSVDVLWQALKEDPNQDNALVWWGAIHYEQGGHQSRINSLKQVAKLTGSWRAQLWIARDYLESGEKQKAIEEYKIILLTDASNYGDVLTMITGDLGNKGYLDEAISLVGPIYKPQVHGAEAGLNLVMTYKQLKMKMKGLELLKEMEILKRYDLKEYLAELKGDFSRM